MLVWMIFITAYLLEHTQRVEDIERRSGKHPGLFIGGNGLRGLGMDSLVRDAEIQASAVIEHLERSPRSVSGLPVHATYDSVEVERRDRAL